MQLQFQPFNSLYRSGHSTHNTKIIDPILAQMQQIGQMFLIFILSVNFKYLNLIELTQ